MAILLLASSTPLGAAFPSLLFPVCAGIQESREFLNSFALQGQCIVALVMQKSWKIPAIPEFPRGSGFAAPLARSRPLLDGQSCSALDT